MAQNRLRKQKRYGGNRHGATPHSYPYLPHAEPELARFPGYRDSRSPHCPACAVWRQLLFPVSDNYFSRSATITTFTNPPCRSTLSLTGAEDKALQGCNLSADSGARPGRGGAAAAEPPRLILG